MRSGDILKKNRSFRLFFYTSLRDIGFQKFYRPEYANSLFLYIGFEKQLPENSLLR